MEPKSRNKCTTTASLCAGHATIRKCDQCHLFNVCDGCSMLNSESVPSDPESAEDATWSATCFTCRGPLSSSFTQDFQASGHCYKMQLFTSNNTGGCEVQVSVLTSSGDFEVITEKLSFSVRTISFWFYPFSVPLIHFNWAVLPSKLNIRSTFCFTYLQAWPGHREHVQLDAVRLRPNWRGMRHGANIMAQLHHSYGLAGSKTVVVPSPNYRKYAFFFSRDSERGSCGLWTRDRDITQTHMGRMCRNPPPMP